MELLLLLFSMIFIMTSFPEKMFNTETHVKISDYLPNNTVPKHYRIWLEVNIEKDVFYGISNVSIIIYEHITVIYLHAVYLYVIQSTMINNIDIPSSEETKYNADNILYLPEVVALYFDKGLPPGNYTLNMEFMGNIKNISDKNVDGFFEIPYIESTTENREWFVATRNLATGIRRTFPCWDDSRFKARFTITVRHHKNYTVLSNSYNKSVMSLTVFNNDNIYHDISQTYFSETPKIPTSLVAIVLCNLLNTNTTVFKNFHMIGRQQFTRNLIFVGHIIENIMHYFQNEWKQLSMFPMHQHLVVPGLIDVDIVKWGLIFYRDDDIIYDQELDSIARKTEIAFLIGRKIGRQLLTNPLRPYFWLNEGIGVLLTMDIIDKTISDVRMSDLFVVQILQESLYLDGDNGIMNPLTLKYNPSSDIISVSSFSYYMKAPAVLRMLQYILSPEVFRKGIDIYLKKQSASLNNFWVAMKTALNEAPRFKNVTPHFDITEIMYPWIKQSFCPVLSVAKYDEINLYSINIDYSKKPWRIPLTYTMLSSMNFDSSNIILDKSGNILVAFNPSIVKDNWIIVNLRQTGYYRANYDTEIWRRIVCYLNSDRYSNIHVLNRAQIIDDAFYFTTMGYLDAYIFKEIIRYLSREIEYIAWYPMIKAIERISYIFPFPDESKYLQTIILNQLDSLLDTIGYNEDLSDNDYIKFLRQEAAKWACILNHLNCKKMALSKLQWHLANPIFNKLMPGWKTWTYCNGLTMANFTVFNEVHDVYWSKYTFYENKSYAYVKDNKILKYLVCFRNFDIYLTRKPEDYNIHHFKETGYPLHSFDNVFLFHYVVAKHAKDASVLDYVLSNWEILKPKEISTTTALIDIINYVYSEKHLYKIQEFITNKNRLPLDYIQNKINRRLSEIRNLIQTFKQVFGTTSLDRVMNCSV